MLEDLWAAFNHLMDSTFWRRILLDHMLRVGNKSSYQMFREYYMCSYGFSDKWFGKQ